MTHGLVQLLLSLLLLMSAGCYSTTALVVHHGPNFEEKTKGTIVAGDKEAVYIQDARTQETRRIEQARIMLLKHPGESKALPALTITMGLVAAIAGSIALIDGLSGGGHEVVDDIKRVGGGIALGVGVLALGVGIPFLISSNASESDSRERLKKPPNSSTARPGFHTTIHF